MSFLHRVHTPVLAARLSETHERVFFLARSEPKAPRRENEDEPPCDAAAGDEDDHG